MPGGWFYIIAVARTWQKQIRMLLGNCAKGGVGHSFSSVRTEKEWTEKASCETGHWLLISPHWQTGILHCK